MLAGLEGPSDWDLRAMKTIDEALTSVPAEIRDLLVADFYAMVTHGRRGDWIDVGTRGGRFAETVVDLLLYRREGKLTKRSRSFRAECDGLMGSDSGPTASRFVKTILPRALCIIYEIRNNGNMAHACPAVDSNRSDGAMVLGLAKWIMAEIVQLCGEGVSADDAQQLINNITRAEFPLVWVSSSGRFRVVDPAMGQREQILLFLRHNGRTGVPAAAEALDMAPASVHDFALELDRDCWLDFDRRTNTLELMEAGQRHIERQLVAHADQQSAADAFWFAGGRAYHRFLTGYAIEKPKCLLWQVPLDNLRHEPGIGTLDASIRAYLYTSAVHHDVAIGFWRSASGWTQEAANELAWLATYTSYESGQRAVSELNYFPRELRETAVRLAHLTNESIFRRPVSPAEAAKTIEELRTLSAKLSGLPLRSDEGTDLVSERTDLVSDATALNNAGVTGGAESLSRKDQALVLQMAIIQQHRALPTWLEICGESAESATALADTVLRPGVRHQVRAAYELSQYPEETRTRAVLDVIRYCDTGPERELLEAVKEGSVERLVLRDTSALLRNPGGKEARAYVESRMKDRRNKTQRV